MNLEIVTHCWRYSRLLTYQLSSLVLYPPAQTQVTMTVFYSREDEETVRVLDFFSRVQAKNVSWRWWPLETRSLMQRAIGRNLAALNTQADWVWFTDADVCFRENCLDELGMIVAEFPIAPHSLIYPRWMWVSRDPQTGDAAIGRLDEGPQIVDLDPVDFASAKCPRAIGPVQISYGPLVRETGYCPGRRFQRPASRWQRCFSDVAFRRRLGTSGVSVELPHVYRIRHSQAGRETVDLRL